MSAESPLTFSLDEVPGEPFDVLIIGSGPAGVAVAEQLYSRHGEVRIGLLERGGILITTHFDNQMQVEPWDAEQSGQEGPATKKRGAFITAHEQHLWTGDYAPKGGEPQSGGMMMLALGGRGIVAGAHLRRFDPTDMHLWKNGRWPYEIEDELAKYSAYAEQRRHITMGDCDGPMQVWVLGQLIGFNPSAPPWGFERPAQKTLRAGCGYDSSVGRLWALVQEDHANNAKSPEQRRLSVVLTACATRILWDGQTVTGVLCRSMKNAAAPLFEVRAKYYVLAAGPIESTRLCLHSGLGGGTAGHFLAEHIYCRTFISVTPVPGAFPGQGVRVIVPPPGDSLEQRFQIEVQGEVTGQKEMTLRITGEAAMDPDWDNTVSLDSEHLEFDVPRAKVTIVHGERWPGDKDHARVEVMKTQMYEIARRLGTTLDRNRIQPMSPGRSHHEAGTLRMGDLQDSPADRYCKIRGTDNLFVADASVSPCVGVANPMLTVTALGYRIADCIGGLLRASRTGSTAVNLAQTCG